MGGRTGNEMRPRDSQGPGFVVGRSSCNCFQPLGNHWLRYPLRAPSWADENVPESLSYQWGRLLLLPCRKDSAVCVCGSRLCSHKLPLMPRPPPPPLPPPPRTLLPQTGSSGVRLERGGGRCKYSGVTLKVFVTPGRRCYLENPAPGWGNGQALFLQLDRWMRPRGRRERKASWTFLTVTASPLRVPCQEHKSRCTLAKVKRRASGCA